MGPYKVSRRNNYMMIINGMGMENGAKILATNIMQIHICFQRNVREGRKESKNAVCVLSFEIRMHIGLRFGFVFAFL